MRAEWWAVHWVASSAAYLVDYSVALTAVNLAEPRVEPKAERTAAHSVD